MKYIDADKLIAEIERYENTANDAYNPHGEDADFWYGKVVACEDFKTFVASLQQERSEVDLEKEIDRYFSKWVQGASDEGCVNSNSQLVSIYDCERIARHFYELGKTRKEE